MITHPNIPWAPRHAQITKPGRLPRTVKNLRWLLSHRNEVTRFRFHYAPAPGHPDGVLSAQMRDGTEYATPYSSLYVCLSFLNRPTWQMLPLSINGRTLAIGDAEFQRLNGAQWKELSAILSAEYTNA